MKRFNLLLISLSLVLVIINFLLLANYDPEIHRWGRVAGSICFLGLFFTEFKRKKILLLLVFSLFAMADVVALNYHEVLMQQIFFAAQSLAYVLLVFRIGRYLLKTRLKTYQKIYFSLVLILNAFFVAIIGDLLAGEVQNSLLQVLFYVYGISAILFIGGGILYYDRFPNQLTTAFLIAVAGLVISNLMGFAAHFLGFTEFFYPDRLLYIFGLAGLMAYSHYFESMQASHEDASGEAAGRELSGTTSAQQIIDEHVEEHNYL